MKTFQHPDGVWRDRANYLLFLELPENGMREQIWARSLGNQTFEVCCLPFLAYGVALGDIVEAPDNIVKRVVTPSGRRLLRIYFRDVSWAREVVDELTNACCLVELRGHLVAIDAVDDTLRSWVIEKMGRYEDEDVLHLEF